jgi:hypothetical protein
MMIIGLTQLRHSASQSHVFACGSKVLADLLYAVFPRVARKNRIQLKNKEPLCRRLNPPTA